MSGNENTIFFWGHGPGSGDAACLSNFYDQAPFTDEAGTCYPTSEHCFMAAKARQFGDADALAAILAAKNPKQAKALGRQVRDFDPAVWASVARERMYEACLLKFRQSRRERAFLLSTGKALLVEASPFDTIWGIGLGAKQARMTPREEWPGINWLGEVLMRVRDILAREVRDVQTRAEVAAVAGAPSAAAAPAATAPAAAVPAEAPAEALAAATEGTAAEAVSPGASAGPEVTHLLVLDFEATCAKDAPNWPHEVIEFPAVLVALGEGKPVAEFTRFVRPTERPALTPFCTELTSITQADVDGAAPLVEVLKEFEAWVAALPVALEAVMPVTCGDWDLRRALPAECARKGLEQPAVLRRWCNVKVAYSACAAAPADKKRPRAPGMAGMLSGLGLELVGRHHRGIDDARNIARIAARLERFALARAGAGAKSSGLFAKPSGVC
eukprot:CAMPEP_0205998778 /NCGR_PEP_ID=MMETSP1464-20131121/431_1 /ASSEMBLY_ACC=CAM_ASM_001124 /TAXON_ID=119497 /ORGANISM="Exanthemachrysis gayraliae, Strain RCC1523" /LENGTH=442 /DNA_ID=CAMNT_0053371933 /DNA_START=26 /DNA_END=1354 /DNA_ORIENTATION=-